MCFSQAQLEIRGMWGLQLRAGEAPGTLVYLGWPRPGSLLQNAISPSRQLSHCDKHLYKMASPEKTAAKWRQTAHGETMLLQNEVTVWYEIQAFPTFSFNFSFFQDTEGDMCQGVHTLDLRARERHCRGWRPVLGWNSRIRNTQSSRSLPHKESRPQRLQHSNTAHYISYPLVLITCCFDSRV